MGRQRAQCSSASRASALPWCLEGLAGVAAARGRHEHAAELDGAREAVRTQAGMLLPPAYPAGYARTLAAVRDALGDEAFDAARTAGRHRPLDQTIAAALAGTVSLHRAAPC